MFSYSSNARRPQTVPCDKDIFETVCKSIKVSQICAEIKDALEKVKRGEMSREDFETYKRQRKIELPAFLFQASFRDNRRHNSSAIPSGLGMFDLDHIETSPLPSPVGDGEAIPLGRLLMQHTLMMQPITDEETIGKLKKLGIVLAHVTPSTEGLRLVFILQEGETPMQGQKRLAAALGIEKYDESVKDLARCSFAVPKDYILYVNYDELFADRNFGCSHCGDAALGVEHRSHCSDAVPGVEQTQATRRPVAGDGDSTNRPVDGDGDSTNRPVAGDATNERVATKATDDSLRIFDEVLSASGLNEENLNSVGTRHNSLITILSMGICRLMPIDQLKAVVSERMPDYSKEKDCQDLIRDFYQKYTDNNRPMSGKLRKIYTDSLKHRGNAALGVGKGKGKAEFVAGDGDATKGDATNVDIDPDNAEKKQDEQAALIKKILKRLPQGLKESVAGVPVTMQMPVLCSVLPIAAAYADGVTVRYCDGAIQRLGLMSIIVGPQASGKSACKKKIDLWERQMKDEDARAREIEDQWKEAKKSRKANEKAPEDPMVLIRSVPATISCSTLLRRFKNSRGHCLWTFCEELDTLRKTNGAGSWSSKYDIYRLGFDYGEWGQDYNSDQAVSGIVNVAYNFSILGTYGAMRKCFHGDNVENGLSSRIIIAEMPDSAFAPMPSYGQPTIDVSSAIDKAVTLLRSQTGFVDTPRLRKAIGEWEEKKRLEAMADGDLVKDTYRKRAGVIGFRCGVVARLLTGKETNAVLDFAVMMAQYVLDEQLKIFGPSLRDEYKKASDEQQRSGSNQSIFDTLPPLFDLQDLRQAKGPDTTNHQLSVIISRWKHSKWIKKVAVNQWKKEPAVKS